MSAPTTTGPTLSPALQKAMTRITEISSLPEITTRIVEVVENPKSTAQDMHEIVKNDPALETKILKVVNSAFYGLPAQIGSLDRAIVMLGLSAVKNIALAASLARLFRPGEITERFNARDLWEHCISVGVCARLLSEPAHAEEAFVAGLVHDIGLLVENQLFPEKFRAVVERCEETHEDFCGAERELLGADHPTFGEIVAQKWKFPPGLRFTIAHHHNPINLKPELRRFIGIVHVADTICCQNEIGFYLTAHSQEISEELLDILQISASAIESVMQVLPDRIEETKQIFSE